MHPCETLRDLFDQSQRILLTGPDHPDADSLGACLALQRILTRWGLVSDVAGQVPDRYNQLPGASSVLPDEKVARGYDAVIVIDGDRHRLTPQVQACFERAKIQGIIDHHVSTQPDGYTFVWLDPEETSTCTMIQKALARWREPLDVDIAQLLYAGTIYDTGGFRYSNTTPETHRLAADLLATGFDHVGVAAKVLVERSRNALRLTGEVFRTAQSLVEGRLVIGRASRSLMEECGADYGDLEGIVDALVHVVGADAAVLLVELDQGRCKFSLRSRGPLNLVPVAQQLSPTGGGHPNAAGAIMDGSIDEGASRVIELLTPRLITGLATTP
jgi:phosphoesterase RecJ-like protein